MTVVIVAFYPLITLVDMHTVEKYKNININTVHPINNLIEFMTKTRCFFH